VTVASLAREGKKVARGQNPTWVQRSAPGVVFCHRVIDVGLGRLTEVEADRASLTLCSRASLWPYSRQAMQQLFQHSAQHKLGAIFCPSTPA
jgi:hypothetical protein